MKNSGFKTKLVGGFNPSEKCESKWESSPNRGEHEKYLKPPPRKPSCLKNPPKPPSIQWRHFFLRTQKPPLVSNRGSFFNPWRIQSLILRGAWDQNIPTQKLPAKFSGNMTFYTPRIQAFSSIELGTTSRKPRSFESSFNWFNVARNVNDAKPKGEKPHSQGVLFCFFWEGGFVIWRFC